MLSERMLAELNLQINYELYSAYFYTAMESYFHEKSLEGFANWFNVQTQEELAHARIMFNYVYRKNSKVTLDAINKPEASFTSILDLLKKGLAHEEFVTGRINTLMNIAMEESDHASRSFLQWFVDEQVEEESNFQNLVSKLELIGSDVHALLMLDAELATRVFTVPAPLAQQP